MLRGFVRTTAAGGARVQIDALAAAGIGKRTIYTDERDGLAKSMRADDGVAVRRLSDLATSKADMRWALMGEDKKSGYKGIFLRGAFVRDLETGADHKSFKSVESVLLATEDWAKERRGRFDRTNGGGRPKKKRTDKHTANAVWKDLVNYPTIDDALASDQMRGWSKSAATRAIKAGGLGPRGALPGRLPKRAES